MALVQLAFIFMNGLAANSCPDSCRCRRAAAHDAVRNRLYVGTGTLAWSINSDASFGMSF
jgi:hypothetical protein